MSYGYTGNILNVNLSTKETWVEHPIVFYYFNFSTNNKLQLIYLAAG